MSYRHILVAMDPAQDPKVLLQRVRQIPHPVTPALTLISVLPDLSAEEEWEVKRDWLDRIEAVRTALAMSVHEVRVESGDIGEQLRLAVDEMQADLLILGRHHHAINWMPSLVDRIVPLTQCDVLLLNPRFGPWSNPPRMQVAVSLDAAGFALIQRAQQIAAAWHSVPEVLHCVSPLANARLALDLESGEEPWLADAVAQAEHQLAGWIARLPSPVPRWQVLVGEPSRQLLHAQQQANSDLLLLGDRSMHYHLLQQHALPGLQHHVHADLLILHHHPHENAPAVE